MWRVEYAELPIQDRSGRMWGHIRIELLPDDRSDIPPLIDRRTDPELATGMAGVQLLEGHEYRYEFVPAGDGIRGRLTTDRPEVFRPDSSEGRTGRLRPGLYTGTLPVNVCLDGQPIGTFELEVRARKLDYFSHYKWMLRDLAEAFAEVIMGRFAPTETRFTFRFDADAMTLYQRFAFLKSIIEDDVLQGAVTHILANPHREWREEPELRAVGQSIPSGPKVVRAVARSGPRVPWRTSTHSILNSLPARMPVARSFETYDTLPNRFVKHVLSQWRNTVAGIERALANAPDTAARTRGLAESRGLLLHLDELLAQPFFRNVSPLTQAPAGNQVLQKRPGYRDVYRLYVQTELAAMLAWSGGEDIYRAGQKDVAVLYEYWVFLQLARVLSDLCQEPLQLERLLEPNTEGLDLRLKHGTERVLTGTVTRHGRTMRLHLWYNRTFRRGPRGSWTRHLRPDCSLCIEVPGYPGRHGGFRNPLTDEFWIHFDAKYRVDTLLDIFGGDAEDTDADGAGAGSFGPGRPVADDLLKMHAYRDAIRRSSGAYVVYPGTEDQLLRRFHEILPGLGAFALRPTSGGTPEGIESIRTFILDVLDHVATQASQHERYRYWEREIFCQPPPADAGLRAVSFLTRPPADTRVLLGYVRSGQHYRWILETGLYNMRADQRTGRVGLHSEQLAAEIVVLYGPELERASLWRVRGDPRLVTRQRMLALGYPDPRSAVYYCLPIEPIADSQNAVAHLTYTLALQLAREIAPGSEYGAPVATTWAKLTEWLSARRTVTT